MSRDGETWYTSGGEYGEYATYDKDGNVLDYGDIENGRYVSMIPEDTTKQDIMMAASLIGASLIMAYIAYEAMVDTLNYGCEETQWYREFKASLDAKNVDYYANMEQYKALMQEADACAAAAMNATGYERERLLNAAAEYESEAWTHHRSIF